MRTTPKYLLIQDRIGGDLEGYLRKLKQARISAPAIARLIAAETEVEITPVTVRDWLRDLNGAVA